MALNGVSILWVEDDPVFRQIVATFLNGRGAQVVQAGDGEQGLIHFKQQRFDIILADLSMPKLGGLDMLKEMSRLEPLVPSIVISGNNVMADVVEALRIGASDYLVKPVADLFIIEQAIQQGLQRNHPDDITQADFDALSHQELNDNLALLEQSVEAAKQVQQQLFPASNISYPAAKVDYSLFKSSDISSYFIDSTMVGSDHLIMYMAHLYPEDNRAAFACVLLLSFVNQKLKSYRSGQSKTIIEPFNMLSYLNERLVKSGLDITVDIVYVAIELTRYRAAIALAGKGLRCYLRNDKGLSPLAISESLPLGVLDWGKPSVQFRTILPQEQLCIATNEPEHKQQLLDNQFKGLVYNSNLPAGGFIQLSL
ncbi:response regulator [Shewanella xiamenensis]|uniref:response regulator n=1 Tax=Shewanella xiamenensis TaxID=332186 RepID=UPI00217CFDAF|nr:response regulator [Shewanella xiamenensis]MCT8857995.1 response regulator [Shewanella xiamenensis]UWG66794.1 response regulator [Shewanella xiamenensis]